MKKTIRLLLISLILIPFNTFALSKKETVYSNLDYDGKVTNTIVTNHIYNKDTGTLEDETELTDILNINGKEKFEINDKKLTWQLSGKDIFYRGNTSKVLPVDTKITYYLNDKEMNVLDMVGKEGKVTIELVFKNNVSNLVKVNGKLETLYTPFVVSVGTMLSSDDTNINITNGKVINTGTKNMLVGISSPGLYESMNIDSLKDLDKITITYDTTNFKLNNIYIVSTPKLLEESDLDIFDKMNSLSSSVYTLKENMDLIESSTKELENGVDTLSIGSNTITTNLKSVLEALKQIEDGSVKLDDGLKLTIKKLKSASEMLKNSDLEGSLANITLLKNKNTEIINKLQIANSSIESIYTEYNLNIVDINTLPDNLQTVKKTYESNIGLIELLNKNNEAHDLTIQNLTSISSNINTLITELSNGLILLENGSNELSNGLTTLRKGVNELYLGMEELNSGINKLNQGTKKLSSGITEFNNKGINTLYNYSIKIKTYSNKAEALINLSKEYKGYTSNNSDNTLFISVVKSAK